MKRLLLLSGLVVLLLMAIAPTASAAIFWCEDDPLVKFVTPAGNVVEVHVTNYGEGSENLSAVQAAAISYKVKSTDGGRGTKVEITVLIPENNGESFKTRSVVSTGEFATGVIYDEANGKSGKPMKLKFKLDVP